MTTPSSPSEANFTNARKRTSTASSITHSIASASHSIVGFTEDLVLHHDPAPGFFAATAQATSQAPTVGEIRRGSLGQDGWKGSGSGSGSRRKSGSHSRRWSNERTHAEEDGRGFAEPMFAPLTEEPTRTDTEKQAYTAPGKAAESTDKTIVHVSSPETPQTRPHHDRIPPITKDNRIYSSGYIPPPTLPWTTTTLTALKAFWKWFLTPFGFLLTLYGLNVVAWGGMLFLLLCNASETMCWAPTPTAENRRHMGDVAALKLGGPKYYNCNDINSPRRVWIEIDSQILNALFCVTGFGLAPWRFRDLYYLLRWRLTSARKAGPEKKLYGLRILAGIHKSWFRLPGSETLDTISTKEYLTQYINHTKSDLETGTPPADQDDLRLPLPLSKQTPPPPTSVRAPATKLWKLDFFIWSQVWNTFFQCCLCGFMWGMDRYARPPWSTGLFVALACGVAGAGGVVSFVEGKKVKRVEGVAAPAITGEGGGNGEDGEQLGLVRTNATGHESIHMDMVKGKG